MHLLTGKPFSLKVIMTIMILIMQYVNRNSFYAVKYINIRHMYFLNMEVFITKY